MGGAGLSSDALLPFTGCCAIGDRDSRPSTPYAVYHLPKDTIQPFQRSMHVMTQLFGVNHTLYLVKDVFP